MRPTKCEAHGPDEAENLPFATNRLVRIDDLKAKIERDDEGKNQNTQKHFNMSGIRDELGGTSTPINGTTHDTCECSGRCQDS
jgi:hypothetical protein